MQKSDQSKEEHKQSLRPALPYVVGFMAVALPLLSGGREPLASLILVVLSALLALLLMGSGQRPVTSVALLAWAAVPLTATLSLIASPVPGGTLSKVLVMLGYGVLLWVTMQFSFSEARKIVGAVIVSGVILTLYGVYVQFFADLSFKVPLSSTYYNANGFAGFLLLLALLTGCRAWSSKDLRSRLIFSLLTASFLWGILATGSRGALVGLAGAAAFGVLVLIRRARGRSWTYRQIGIAVAAALLITGAGVVTTMALPNQGGVAAAFQDEPRMDYWSGAVQLGSQSPLIGNGAGSFARLYPTVQKEVLGFSRDPHSRLFEAFAETGTLGLIAILAFYGTVIWVAWRSIVSASDDQFPLIFATMVAAVGFLIHGSIDLQWGFIATPAIFFILLGVGSRAAFKEIAPNRLVKSGAVALVALVTLAGVAEYVSAVNTEGGLLSASLNRHEDARSQLEMAVLTNPFSPLPHFYLAYYHSTPLKEFASASAIASLNAARREIKMAEKLDPLNPQLYAMAADLDRKEAAAAPRGKKDLLNARMEQNLGKALSIDEWGHPEIELEYAIAVDDKGATGHARELYKDITGKYSEQTLASIRSWFAGNLSRAEITAQTQSDPGLRERLMAYFGYADASVGAHYRLALLYKAEGKIDLARKHLETAMRIDPESELVKKALKSLKKASD